MDVETTALFEAPKHKLKKLMSQSAPDGHHNNQGHPTRAASMAALEPIADLFPKTTILFADLAGFTAWSSEREPSQVFTLLEVSNPQVLFTFICKRGPHFSFLSDHLSCDGPSCQKARCFQGGNSWRLLCSSHRTPWCVQKHAIVELHRLCFDRCILSVPHFVSDFQIRKLITPSGWHDSPEPACFR